ncbi:hypothetical protein [Methylocystis heyeri]|uniref:Uncharacterized protein n=1 Tax=Methylocystis heyeri TaxID=391905 RepID=A0A6B8KHI7_9HYPH|nr:hypothetical protein [Methylocystis heyeri]QGM47092.1 hypothetical protein H2LOC_016120 [Methylocystis heyeri]
MKRVLRYGACLMCLTQSAAGQQYESGGGHSYLSGETANPYAYQRHTEDRSSDYGYRHPANGYAYPYEDGEHYSPYAYDRFRGYRDR